MIEKIVKGAVESATDTAKTAAKTAAKEATNSTPFGKAISKIGDMGKSAIAANHANDMMKAGHVGTFRKIVGFVPDIAGDAANVLTLGGFGHLRNVYNRVTSGVKLDYKNVKAMLKENPDMTIKERANAMVRDASELDVPAEAAVEGPEIEA